MQDMYYIMKLNLSKYKINGRKKKNAKKRITESRYK